MMYGYIILYITGMICDGFSCGNNQRLGIVSGEELRRGQIPRISTQVGGSAMPKSHITEKDIARLQRACENIAEVGVREDVALLLEVCGISPVLTQLAGQRHLLSLGHQPYRPILA